MIAGRSENLLAITTMAIAHQAAPDQNRIRSFCPEAPRNPTAPTKNSLPIETPIEFLYRVPADGTAAHQTSRTDALLHRHRQMHTPKKLFITAGKEVAGMVVPVPGFEVGLSSAQGILSDSGTASSAHAAALLLSSA